MDNLNSLLKAIFPCLPISTVERGIQLPAKPGKHQHISEKAALQPTPRGGEKFSISCEQAASSIVSAMVDADKNDRSLDVTIKSLVHQAGGWSNWLASKIVEGLAKFLEAEAPMNAAMRNAYDKACEEAKKMGVFAADHPVLTAVFFTVIAMGILVVLAPYVVEWLGFWVGFGEEGPIAGKWCFPRSIEMTTVN